jgi:tRNA 2-thiouridine synthesizing protein E
MSNQMLLQPATDNEGYLLNLQDWSPTIAEQLAATTGIQLKDDHWQIIHILRSFYQSTGISPAMRILVKLVRRELGETKGNSIHLLQLFPNSPAKLASKIAGLPRPTNCL